MSHIADFTQSGYWPLQDHRSGIEPNLRATPAAVRLINPKGNDDPWFFVWDEKDGVEIRGDVHPWRWWHPGSRGFGSFAQAMFAVVDGVTAHSSHTDPASTASLVPIRKKDYSRDSRYAAASQPVPYYWPVPAKGTIVLGGVGTEESSQEELFGWLDPRLVAANESPHDRMGSLVVDLDPANTLSRRRIARLQTSMRVAHVPVLPNLGNDPAWTAAWQLALTGQGSACGFGPTFGAVDTGEPGEDTPADDEPPVTTPGDEWEGGGQPEPTGPGDGEGARVGGETPPAQEPGDSGHQPGDAVEPGAREPSDDASTPPSERSKGSRYGVGLASRDAWGPLHIGHKDDKHRHHTNDDGEPVNSLHMDPDRTLWYRDKKHDAPLEFDRIPYGPVKAPIRVQAWIRYDEITQHDWVKDKKPGLWRLEAQCFWTGKRPPHPTPTPNPPPVTPAPPATPPPPTRRPPGDIPPPGEPGFPDAPPAPTPPSAPPPTNPGFPDDPTGPPPDGGGQGPIPGWPPSFPGPGDPDPWRTQVARYVQKADRSNPWPEAVSYTPQQVGVAGILAYPQHLNRGGVDLRFATDPGHDVITEESGMRPAVGRWEAWGAEAGELWAYNETPESSRVPGGTASGGWLIMPPEVDRKDLDASYAPSGVTVSTTYLAVAPGAYFGAGMDATDGDMADDSWRWTDTSAELVFQLKAAGSWATKATLKATGIDTTGVYMVGGTQVVGAQQAAIADPVGGGTVDTEARAAVASLLAELRLHGLIALV